MRPLIIERPDLQSAAQRIGSLTVTLLFWLIWVYVWVPVATLLVWALEIKFLYEHMVVLSGGTGLLRLLPYYALAVLAIGVILVGWAKINERRFSGHERRGEATQAGPDALAHFFAVDAQSLQSWQALQRVRVHLDAAGNVTQVDSLPALAAGCDSSRSATRIDTLSTQAASSP